MEKWLPIPKCFDYAVSNMGRVKRVTGGAGAVAGKVLKPIRNLGGYHQVKLGKHGPICTIHSLVLLAFSGQRPTGFQINHKNGKKTDNRQQNLEYVSHLDNDRHAQYVLRVKPRGSRHGMAKLTEAKVRQIRKLRKKGLTLWNIANRFGVTAANVDYICKGQAWRHVT